MQFQSLLSLWFGLTLPVIVLMYILKRKYADTVVPSHLLWNRVLRNLEANTPWQKLRNNLLLLLQLLIAALLVLALMQPFVWSSGGVKNHVVIVLDRSVSMDALTAGNDENGQRLTRLEQAKRDIIQLVKKEASGSAVTLIAMGGEPDVLVSREVRSDEIQAALDAVTPFYGKTAYKETMSLAAALTQDDKDSEIRVFTDGRWTESPAGLVFHVPVIVVREGQEGSVDNVRVVQFGVKLSGSAASDNASAGFAGVAGGGASQSAAAAGLRTDAGSEQVTAVAMLKNEGSNKKELDIELYNGGSLGETRREILQPGEQKSVYFDNLAAADYYKLSVQAEGDALAADNQAFAFLPGERTKKVLLVTEGNVFLEKALQLSHAEVTKLQSGGTEPLTPPRNAVDMIVLDSVKAEAIAGKAWQELLAQKPVWYIRTPAQTAEVNVAAGEYQISDHPVTQYIRLQDTHIARLQQVEAVPWGKAVISLGLQPIVYAGTDQGQPKLLFAFDLHQSDLPLRSEFPVLVQNAVEWMGSRQAASLGRAVAGSRIDIPLSGKTAAAEWRPLDVIGKPASAIAAEKAEGAVTSSQPVPNRPGLYQFVEHPAAGAASSDANAAAERRTYLEVIADPQESAAAPPQKLVFAMPDAAGAQSDSRARAGAGTDGTAPPQPASDPGGVQTDTDKAAAPVHSSETDGGRSLYPLVRWIALLVTILMFVEWGVYRRGTSI
ncbi:vWA domain-containing protein [Paenibacillus piri]|uniref:VWA domain-containing protein n=1 Tax=Paenibacillus piri TaxID=2547395 RepID=A0A4R5KEW3_9BACL|nr:VWA domain-containing protein [Paenibacillus piri]TDF93786.1 VWA domain-containing protein [Paenibacillus piri]